MGKSKTIVECLVEVLIPQSTQFIMSAVTLAQTDNLVGCLLRCKEFKVNSLVLARLLMSSISANTSKAFYYDRKTDFTLLEYVYSYANTWYVRRGRHIQILAR
jgi:hypothetical protein